MLTTLRMIDWVSGLLAVVVLACAPWGLAPAAERGSDFWAFQPPRRHAPPAVRDSAWPCSPVDYFLLASLEKRGLRPTWPVDRLTLLRRVTIDLTGLPPTSAEM